VEGDKVKGTRLVYFASRHFKAWRSGRHLFDDCHGIYAFFIFLFGGPTPNIIRSIIGSVLICALTTFFVGSFVGITVWNQHEKDYSNITGDDHVV
jgi:hypothetical protein